MDPKIIHSGDVNHVIKVYDFQTLGLEDSTLSQHSFPRPDLATKTRDDLLDRLGPDRFAARLAHAGSRQPARSVVAWGIAVVALVIKTGIALISIASRIAASLGLP